MGNGEGDLFKTTTQQQVLKPYTRADKKKESCTDISLFVVQAIGSNKTWYLAMVQASQLAWQWFKLHS